MIRPVIVIVGAVLLSSVAAFGQANPNGPSSIGGSQVPPLLPPALVQKLNLTPPQKKNYTICRGDFQGAVEDWGASHPNYQKEFRQAQKSGDQKALEKLRAQRQELMDIRKRYVETFRATLPADQQKTLDAALAHAPFMGEQPKQNGPKN